jgi:hypothetical protein
MLNVLGHVGIAAVRVPRLSPRRTAMIEVRIVKSQPGIRPQQSVSSGQLRRGTTRIRHSPSPVATHSVVLRVKRGRRPGDAPAIFAAVSVVGSTLKIPPKRNEQV